MKKYTTVVFDFDGTIADTNNLIIGSWQSVFMARRGEEGDEKMILSTFGEPLYETMEKLFPEFDVEESVDIYRTYQREIFLEQIGIFPGVKALIEELKAKGYKVGIATSRLRESTIMGLRKFGLEDSIDALVTVEDTDKHKPDPDPALICLEKLGSTPEESIMVGDSAYDMGCGKNAGMTTVLVGWSEVAKSGVESTANQSIDKPAKDGVDNEMNVAGSLVDIFKPDYIIETAEALWELLD